MRGVSIMSGTKKLIESLNASEELRNTIYSAWIDFKGKETDSDKLVDLANEFMDTLRSYIEDDRGGLL